MRQSLYANTKLLAKARVEKANALANVRASRPAKERRLQPMTTPAETSTAAQHDQRILQIEGQIEGARARIPYLEAIIAREEPPELYPDPEAANDRMAAE